jgi:hypothetical protein
MYETLFYTQRLTMAQVLAHSWLQLDDEVRTMCIVLCVRTM